MVSAYLSYTLTNSGNWSFGTTLKTTIDRRLPLATRPSSRSFEGSQSMDQQGEGCHEYGEHGEGTFFVVRRPLDGWKLRVLKDHDMKNRLGTTDARHAALSSMSGQCPPQERATVHRQNESCRSCNLLRRPTTTDKSGADESKLRETLIGHAINSLSRPIREKHVVL